MELHEKHYSTDNLPVLREDETHGDYHLKNHDFTFNCTDLSAIQMDIMALMLTYMTKEDWANKKFPTYEFDSNQLTKWFGCASKQLYSKLKEPSKALSYKNFSWVDDINKEFSYLPLFKGIEYKKGILTMSPNDMLRDIYLVTSDNESEKKNGFSKIYNDVYKSLSVPNSKRVFEMMSRFRNRGVSMYAQDVKNLQRCLGIIGSDGTVLKKTYSSEKTFISRIIAPAIEQISALPEAKKRLVLKRSSEQGTLGYEVTPKSSDPKSLKLKFLVEWLDDVTPVEKERDLNAELIEALDEARYAKKNGERTIPYLRKAAEICFQLGHVEEHMSFKAKVKDLEDLEQLEKERLKNLELDNEKELVKRELKEFDLSSF